MEPVFYLPISSKKSDNLDFYRSLAVHYEAGGVQEKAEDLYQIVLNLNSDDPVALENIGTLGLRRGQWKRLLKYYKKAFNTNKTNSWAWGKRTRACAQKLTGERQMVKHT